MNDLWSFRGLFVWTLDVGLFFFFFFFLFFGGKFSQLKKSFQTDKTEMFLGCSSSQFFFKIIFKKKSTDSTQSFNM